MILMGFGEGATSEENWSEGKGDVTEEMIKGVVDWIWRLCNMAIESGSVLEEWKSAVVVPVYSDKEEKTEGRN